MEDNVKTFEGGAGADTATKETALGVAILFKKVGWIEEVSNGGFKLNLPTTFSDIPSSHVYSNLQAVGMAILPVIRSYAQKGAAAA